MNFMTASPEDLKAASTQLSVVFQQARDLLDGLADVRLLIAKEQEQLQALRAESGELAKELLKNRKDLDLLEQARRQAHDLAASL